MPVSALTVSQHLLDTEQGCAPALGRQLLAAVCCALRVVWQAATALDSGCVAVRAGPLAVLVRSAPAAARRFRGAVLSRLLARCGRLRRQRPGLATPTRLGAPAVRSRYHPTRPRRRTAAMAAQPARRTCDGTPLRDRPLGLARGWSLSEPSSMLSSPMLSAAAPPAEHARPATQRRSRASARAILLPGMAGRAGCGRRRLAAARGALGSLFCSSS